MSSQSGTYNFSTANGQYADLINDLAITLESGTVYEIFNNSKGHDYIYVYEGSSKPSNADGDPAAGKIKAGSTGKVEKGSDDIFIRCPTGNVSFAVNVIPGQG